MYAVAAVITLLAQLVTAALPEIQLTKQPSLNGDSGHASRLRRRGGTVGISTAENFQIGLGGGYLTTMTFGTGHPQSLQLLIDTATSDTFVLSPDFCSHASACGGGTYDSKKSDTFIVVNQTQGLLAKYGDGSIISGTLVKDAVTIGNLVVSNVEFGLAQNYSGGIGNDTGILGLGYSSWETSAPHQQYPNIPEVLKANDVINSRLYSVCLDESSNSGSVLFGGLDQSKYSGQLVTLDLLPDGDSTISDFTISVTGLATISGSPSTLATIFTNDTSASVPSQLKGAAFSAQMCIGCAAVTVPQAYYQALVSSAFSFINSSDLTCSCNHRYDNASLQVEFGGLTTITVPARDVIVPILNSTGGQRLDTSGKAVCQFLVLPSTDGSYLIGEPILKTMYMVYDLDNGQVSIAQAVINSTAQSDIRTVAAGPSGVASAANRVQTAPANTLSIPAAASTNAVYSISTISSSSTSTSATLTGKAGSTGGSSGTSVSVASATPSKGAAADHRTLGSGLEGAALAAVVIAGALM